MRIKYILQIILIGQLMFSCSSDDSDNSINNNEESFFLYKKSTEFVDDHPNFEKVITYNESNNNIESIITTDYHNYTETISVNYNENSISSLIVNSSYEYQADITTQYDIIIENNIIKLISEDIEIEINHSNRYVNSTKKINAITSNLISEQIFTRDNNLNLIRNNDNNGNLYEYSNFDSDKKNAPLGSVIRCSYLDFFRIFDLKLSNNNPLNAFVLTSQGVPNSFANYLEYDEKGYVIKTSKEPESTTNYILHQYIEE